MMRILENANQELRANFASNEHQENRDISRSGSKTTQGAIIKQCSSASRALQSSKTHHPSKERLFLLGHRHLPILISRFHQLQRRELRKEKVETKLTHALLQSTDFTAESIICETRQQHTKVMQGDLLLSDKAADLTQCDLSQCDLSQCDLSQCDL